eukprot:s2311_g2.t1
MISESQWGSGLVPRHSTKIMRVQLQRHDIIDIAPEGEGWRFVVQKRQYDRRYKNAEDCPLSDPDDRNDALENALYLESAVNSMKLGVRVKCGYKCRGREGFCNKCKDAVPLPSIIAAAAMSKETNLEIIADTGSEEELISHSDLEVHFKDKAKKIPSSPVSLITANGPVDAETKHEVYIEALMNSLQFVELPSTPAVCSVGKKRASVSPCSSRFEGGGPRFRLAAAGSREVDFDVHESCFQDVIFRWGAARWRVQGEMDSMGVQAAAAPQPLAEPSVQGGLIPGRNVPTAWETLFGRFVHCGREALQAYDLMLRHGPLISAQSRDGKEQAETLRRHWERAGGLVTRLLVIIITCAINYDDDDDDYDDDDDGKEDYDDADDFDDEDDDDDDDDGGDDGDAGCGGGESGGGGGGGSGVGGGSAEKEAWTQYPFDMGWSACTGPASGMRAGCEGGRDNIEKQGPFKHWTFKKTWEKCKFQDAADTAALVRFGVKGDLARLNDASYKSGMRSTQPIEMTIDPIKAMEAGCEFFVTEAEGVLTRGTIPPSCIIGAVDTTKKDLPLHVAKEHEATRWAPYRAKRDYEEAASSSSAPPPIQAATAPKAVASTKMPKSSPKPTAAPITKLEDAVMDDDDDYAFARVSPRML